MLVLLMKSLIEIAVSKEHFQEILAEYAAEGFDYVSARPSENDSESLVVLFRGDIHNVSHYSSENNKSYLEFGDGSLSPLYIKRNRDFWED
jgi:hypothetical protein